MVRDKLSSRETRTVSYAHLEGTWTCGRLAARSIDSSRITDSLSRDHNNCEARFSRASWMQSSLGHDTFAIYRNLLFTSIPCRHSYSFYSWEIYIKCRIARKKRTCKHSLFLSHVPFALATFATISALSSLVPRHSWPRWLLSQHQIVPTSNEEDPEGPWMRSTTKVPLLTTVVRITNPCSFRCRIRAWIIMQYTALDILTSLPIVFVIEWPTSKLSNISFEEKHSEFPEISSIPLRNCWQKRKNLRFSAFYWITKPKITALTRQHVVIAF